MNTSEINKIIQEAQAVAASDYTKHEPTARNHAKLQSMQVVVNGELIKTIRTLDEKNSKLQQSVVILSVVATVASIIALFK